MFLSVLEGSVISRINGEKKDEKKKESTLTAMKKICHLEFASK